MRSSKLALALALGLAAILMPTQSQAAPHGCVSVTSSYWVGADAARRSLAAGVHTNEPCWFYYSPGDTYSGSGAFIVKCSSGGRAMNPDYPPDEEYQPALFEPIPQPCKPGAKVTIHANQPFRGGAVVAGNPAFAQLAAPALVGASSGSSDAQTHSVRYVVPPFQVDQPPEPVPALAPNGIYRIVPNGRTVTVTIEDDLAPGGSFLFKICQKNGYHPGAEAYCGTGPDDVSTGDICYTGPTTLRRVVPGNPVEVTLWFAPSPCPDAPTTGTMTIVG